MPAGAAGGRATVRRSRRRDSRLREVRALSVPGLRFGRHGPGQGSRPPDSGSARLSRQRRQPRWLPSPQQASAGCRLAGGRSRADPGWVRLARLPLTMLRLAGQPAADNPDEYPSQPDTRSRGSEPRSLGRVSFARERKPAGFEEPLLPCANTSSPPSKRAPTGYQSLFGPILVGGSRHQTQSAEALD